MENNENFSVSFIKFDAVPIPTFQSRINSQYVKFGDDNSFPQMLIDFLNGSAKHNAIIENKVSYILGGGMKSENEADANAISFIKKNSKTIERVINDLEVFNGFYIECLPTLGNGWQFSHVPFETIRKNYDETIFYFRRDWKVFTGRSIDKKEYKRFNPDVREVSIIEYKGYRSGLNTYALPAYTSALNYISADCQVARHTLGNATGGFTGSKMISFFDGKPKPEQQREIESGVKDKFTGGDGAKLLLTFNNESAKKPEVEDLGASDLTKEDFTAIDDMICANIYAGHLADPILFAVPNKNHSLGGNAGAEIRMKYDTFYSTYVAKRVDIIEKLIAKLASIAGVQSKITLVRPEPPGIEITPEILSKILPKDYWVEKLGIDLSKYTEAPLVTDGVAPAAMEGEPTTVNEHLKNLTAKQNQQVLRIIRQFKKGTIDQETAKILLSGGYGLTEDEVNKMLGISQQFADLEDEEDFAALIFEQHGESENDFIAFDEKPFEFKDVAEDDINAKIVRVLEKDPKATAETIASELSISKELASEIINNIDSGGGRILTKLPKMEVRYKYKLRPGVAGPAILETTRPFCKRVLTSGKLYSTKDIQKMSVILGYDVMRRSGGFWNKGNGKTDIQCRHYFVSQIVIRKK